MNKEITFYGQLGQGRHARVRLGLIGQQYRAIKMFETRFQNEFERERTIFQTDLIEHPNILGLIGSEFFFLFKSNFSSSFLRCGFLC